MEPGRLAVAEPFSPELRGCGHGHRVL